MIGHEGGRRAGRAGRRHQQAQAACERSSETRPRGAGSRPGRKIGIGIALHAREPRFHHRDQRRHRREGKLEAHAEDRLRLDGDDGEDREGEIAHGERAPVQRTAPSTISVMKSARSVPTREPVARS